MTTSGQGMTNNWPQAPEADRTSQQYDLQAVDQFYRECQALAGAEQEQRMASKKARAAERRDALIALVIGILLCLTVIGRALELWAI